jgi:hypothetical protein
MGLFLFDINTEAKLEGLTGTDENSLKNLCAAAELGTTTTGAVPPQRPERSFGLSAKPKARLRPVVIPLVF